MADLFFKHDVTLAVGVGKTIEARAGEILAGVPENIAARLLARHDVVLADPGADVRRMQYADPRRHSDVVASLVSPPLDMAKLVADEKLAHDAAEAKKSLAARAKQQQQDEAAAAKAEADRAELAKMEAEDAAAKSEGKMEAPKPQPARQSDGRNFERDRDTRNGRS